MPFKSKAQAKFLFAKHPGIAERFAAETKSIKNLPEHKMKKMSKFTAKKEADVSFPKWESPRMTDKNLKTKKAKKGKRK